MAEPTCVRCGGREFIFSPIEVRGAKYPLGLVQCVVCGDPEGTLEVQPRVDLAKRVEGALSQLGRVIARIQATIDRS
ncbi:MAG: hypothetical protein JOZ27_02890 [Caulobacteraceae bacterium]|nr:hypothetical protein [Caulobacteraceae bacterium]